MQEETRFLGIKPLRKLVTANEWTLFVSSYKPRPTRDSNKPHNAEMETVRIARANIQTEGGATWAEMGFSGRKTVKSDS